MTQKLLASNTQLAHMMLDIGVCCPVFQLYGLKNSIFKIIADKFHLIAGTFLSLVMQHASFLLVKSTRGGIFNKEPGAFRLILELVICDISFVVQVVLVENFICSIHVGFVNIEIFIDFLTISSLKIICQPRFSEFQEFVGEVPSNLEYFQWLGKLEEWLKFEVIFDLYIGEA